MTAENIINGVIWVHRGDKQSARIAKEKVLNLLHRKKSLLIFPEATAVIGAGSVVTRDIPGNVFACGVPCKVIREITDEDRIM